MPFEHLLPLANAIINSIGPDTLSDATLEKLRALFPEKLIIAALDLIDRGNVFHCITSWGHSEYEVLGSTATYSVLVDLEPTRIPYSCTCPAFAYSVLMAGTHIMCKHVLATFISHKMNSSIKRPTNVDDLAAIFTRQFPIPVPNAREPGAS
ncbi:unnamed protein product [Cyclocybe aegerita]|uniref:SWIM-type domain-containing protein n=1 Tax=Cyclocybe aegerita TaxID=1973307 RepID=A0A8S0VY23_CYCAE|nr:unnamed protein product [Cyclocybe aegerita]